MEDEKSTVKRRRGRPITHPPVRNLKTGKVYSTYTEAALDVGGNRYGVMRAAYGYQRTHMGDKWGFDNN